MHWLFSKKRKGTQISSFFETFSTTFFFIKTLSKYFLIPKSTKLLGQPLFSKIFLSLSISWWKCSKFDQSLNALCNNVNNKLIIFIWIWDQTFKVVKSSAKGRFALNWSHEFVIVTSYYDVKKRYGLFIFSLRGEFDAFVLTI